MLTSFGTTESPFVGLFGWCCLTYFPNSWILKTKNSCGFSIVFMCCIVFTNFQFLPQRKSQCCFTYWTICMKFCNVRAFTNSSYLNSSRKSWKLYSASIISFVSFSFFGHLTVFFTCFSYSLELLRHITSYSLSSAYSSLREKCPNTEFFLVPIFLYSETFYAVRSFRNANFIILACFYGFVLKKWDICFCPMAFIEWFFV